jgi:hypothetical protein
MKKITMSFVIVFMLLSLSISLPVLAADETYGADGASRLADSELNLSMMLTFALQDEYLARGEYAKVMEKFGKRRPFVNIIKAEERHISWLKPLFNKYNVAIPADRGLEFAKVPATFTEALQTGVDAEVANIAMYERFLKQDLPADVKDVFERLLAASQNHLTSFRQGGKKDR